MAKNGFFKTLLGLAVTAGAVLAVKKYMDKYTDYKPAGDEDMEDIKASGEKVKDAAKRTYVAIKENGDVREAAGDLLDAAKEAADDAGRLAETVGNNTAEFVSREKARFEEDPEVFGKEVSENFKSLGDDIKAAANAAKDAFEKTVGEESRLKDIRDQAAKRYQDATENKEA